MPTSKDAPDAFLREMEARGLVPTGRVPAAAVTPKPKRPRKPPDLIEPEMPRYGRSPAWVELVVPAKIESRPNLRDWRVINRADKKVDVALGTILRLVPDEVKNQLARGCVVKLTRIGPVALDDDNLTAGFKRTRDDLSVWLLGGRMGEMDGDGRIAWRKPTQRPEGRKFGFVVCIWEAGR